MPLTLPEAVDIVLGRAPIPEGVTRADADLCAAVHRMLADAKRYPLAAVRLWRPECLRCDDRSKPGAYRPSPVDGVECRGVTMVPEGDRWRCPGCGVVEARTSQWAAVRDILASAAVEVIILGGNRSSKTTTGAILGTLCARGAADPEVRVMLAANGLQPGRLNAEPRPVYVVGITGADSVKTQRPKYEELGGPGLAWRNRDGPGDSTIGPPDASPGRPGTCNFLSAERGAKAFQGVSAGLVHHDEDHADWEVWQEAGWRVADCAGWQLLTATPTRGWTPLLTGLMRPETPRPPPLVCRLDSLDNPHVRRDSIDRMLRGLSPTLQRMRRMGDVVALEGLVHPGFDRLRHVVAPVPIPPEAPRWMAIDWGVRDPFAALWLARVGEVLHVYRGRYEAGCSLTEHARAIHRAEACPACWAEQDPRGEANAVRLIEGCRVCREAHPGRSEPYPRRRVADSAGLDQRKEFHAMALPTVPATKDRAAGYLAIEELLQADADGRVGLVIHDVPGLRPLIEELEGLRWRRDDPTGTARQQMQTEGADHAWDALRYALMAARAG